MTLFKTFKVTRTLGEPEVQALKGRFNNVENLFPLKNGYVGLVPQIPANYPDGNNPNRFIWVELLRYTKDGLSAVPNTPMGRGKCLVPLDNIEIGPAVTGQFEIVSELGLGHPTLRISPGLGVTRFKAFLDSLFASFATEENRNAMKTLGVSERVVDLIGNASKSSTLVREFLNGK